jgi:putrescine transport system ATP-binding protein
VTFVVVTHDQEEAMTLSDRIAVMDKGQVMQIGSPTEVYEYPNSRFVAGFIGSITTFDGTVTGISDGMATLDVPALGGSAVARSLPGLVKGSGVTLALRPEKISITRDRPEGPNAFAGVVRDLGYFGKDSLYRVALPTGQVVSVNSVNARRVGEAGRVADWEDAVWLSFDPTAAILLQD